ncbi:phosphate ABC transporter permease PstA [Magnetovirga frankeli]|uniref:phosphate ABC transporter permease PstA n=1 Tax=Magnetovirga frankeli TaxID=947516 RepID=UPI001293B6B4|nr:phosphate ABC transporter permease PstA [gamma proteobacterium SS-5]
MAASTEKMRTIDIVQKNLDKRYRAERRFRLFGLLAVVTGLLFVSALFIDIISKGHGAFMQTFIQLDVELSAKEIDPKGSRDPEVLRQANYLGLVKRSMREMYPEVTGRGDKRDLYAIPSTGANMVLRDLVLNNPDLVGSRQQIWVPADDDIDVFNKGGSTDIESEVGRGIASPSGVEGEISIMTTTNSFTPILAEVKENLVEQAREMKRDVARLKSSLSSLDASIAELDQQIQQAQDGNPAHLHDLQGEREDQVNQRTLNAAEAERLAAEAIELQRRADTPGGEEALNGDLPSYLLKINGGLVKVDRVSNVGIVGRVLLPLESAREAGDGSWSLLTLQTPENNRRLKDKMIAWTLKLRDQGRMEKRFNTTFFTAGDSREPELAGIGGAFIGSMLTLAVTLLLSFPIGVAAAVYLEEFAPKNRWTDLIEVNINNLAAVPSIVFGLLGLAVFINFFGMPRSAPLVGGVVLTLMTLPTIIIASRAALKSVPPSIREAALGVGASPLQTVTHHVLPLAMPGMLTGTIIGMAQALGETAPLLMIGMVAFVVDLPGGVFDPSTVLPVQIFLWADSPERAFVERTSAAIMVLLAFLITMNALAVYLRKKFERRW